MHPIFYEPFAGQRFGLRYFVFVVGKYEISAAAVNIYLIAERLSVHRRAFYMPAGATLSPGGFPENLAFFSRFPEREIERVALVLVVVYSYAVKRVFKISVRKSAVGGE